MAIVLILIYDNEFALFIAFDVHEISVKFRQIFANLCKICRWHVNDRLKRRHFC